MSWALTLLEQPAIERMGWTLMHFLWEGAALALLLCVALAALRSVSANVRYLAGCAVLLVMAAAPVMTFALLGSPEPNTVMLSGEEGPSIARVTDIVESPTGGIPPLSIIEAALPEGEPVLESEAANPPGFGLADRVERFAPYMVIGWVVGVLLLSVRLLGGWVQAHRIGRRGIAPVSQLWQRRFRRLVRRLDVRRPVRLVESTIARVPMVVGHLRPVLLLPVAALTGLSTQQVEAILAHELGHIRRWDYLVNLLQRVIEVLLFYHPCVWWVSHSIRQEREHCCDDLGLQVCGDRFAYARALIGIAELDRSVPQLAVAANGRCLLHRIRRIIGLPQTESLYPTRWIAGLGGLLILTVATLGLDLIAVGQISEETSQDQTVADVRDLVAEGEHKSSGSHQSGAWYLLRQSNIGPLLGALPFRLSKFASSTDRTDAIWAGRKGGERMELDIAVEGDVSGKIVVGFFSDPKWSGEPVRVCEFPGPGLYTVEGLPPGGYQIGAVIGLAVNPKALGVHRNWPAPVQVKQGGTASAQVLVSSEFKRGALGHAGERVCKDFAGLREKMNVDNLLQGKVTGPDGEPVPFATVQIRERRKPGQRGIAAPNVGTDEQGKFFFDKMNWEYSVGALRYEPLPSLFGSRHQYIRLNRYFEGPKKVDFQFDTFPTGTAVVSGKAVDQHGDPVKGFVLDVRTKVDWDDRSGESLRQFGYKVPFVSSDGSFRLSNLPEGQFSVRAIPLDRETYELLGSDPLEVKLVPHKVTEVVLKLTKKPPTRTYYGRVLFEDGEPAFLPAPWSGGKVYVTRSFSGSRRRSWSATGGSASVPTDRDGYFALPLFDEQLQGLRDGESTLWVYCPVPGRNVSTRAGMFPDELLSRDRSKGGSIEIPRPCPKGQTFGSPVTRGGPASGNDKLKLAVGDVINVGIMDLFTEGYEHRAHREITRDGTIHLPLLERPVRAAGLTAQDLSRNIAGAYGNSYSVVIRKVSTGRTADGTVYHMLLADKSSRTGGEVYITGDGVGIPGTYALPAGGVMRDQLLTIAQYKPEEKKDRVFVVIHRISDRQDSVMTCPFDAPLKKKLRFFSRSLKPDDLVIVITSPELASTTCMSLVGMNRNPELEMAHSEAARLKVLLNEFEKNRVRDDPELRKKWDAIRGRLAAQRMRITELHAQLFLRRFMTPPSGTVGKGVGGR